MMARALGLLGGGCGAPPPARPQGAGAILIRSADLAILYDAGTNDPNGIWRALEREVMIDLVLAS